jgi:hypothetical protein
MHSRIRAEGDAAFGLASCFRRERCRAFGRIKDDQFLEFSS